MLYFKQNEDKIEKYEVTFDKEKIQQLNQEIIDNCSFIEHNEFESDYCPRFTDRSLIKNFKSIMTSETKEYFEETRDIYKYIYDEYKPPYLVTLVKNLLAGDKKAIDQILNYDTKEIITIDDKINRVNQKLISTSPTDIKTKKELLERLEELLKTKEKNKNQKSINTYYDKLISLINFDLVDSISISELNKIENFLETQLVDKYIKKSNDNEKVKIKIKNN